MMRRLFLLTTVLVFVSSATAERGRGVILHVADDAESAALATPWNADLGRAFDMIAAPYSEDAETLLDPFTIGVKALWTDEPTQAVEAAQNAPDSVMWVILDMREATIDVDEIISVGDVVHEEKLRLALIPGPEDAAPHAAAVAPSVDAYIMPVSDLSEASLSDIQKIADDAARAHGKIGIGCALDGAGLTGPDDAGALLEFIDRTDDFVAFFFVDWPEDSEVTAEVLGWLNQEIEGPQASLGMHQDRLSPPEHALDPEVESRLRMAMGVSSVVFLVIAIFVLFVWFKPVNRKPTAP